MSLPLRASRPRLNGLLLACGLVAGGLIMACASEPAPLPEDTPKDPVLASATVDRAVATTGDVLTYTVVLDYDPAYEVLLPEPGADIAGFRILDLGREPVREERGRTIEERWYRLRADLVGSYVLPPLTVRYRQITQAEAPETEESAAIDLDAEEFAESTGSDETEEWSTLQTSEIFVEVESVLPADGEVTDIRDIKPITKVDEPLPWTWLAAGGGALLLLAGLGVWWWRRSRAAQPARPPRPAHEVAFAALDDLRGTDFADPDAVHSFYFRLSEILRTYVEARFGLNATDLTTEEILAQLREGQHFLPQADVLRRFLLATDQVKFADHHPAKEEIHAAYEDALGYVEATQPTEVAAEEGSEKEPTDAATGKLVEKPAEQEEAA